MTRGAPAPCTAKCAAWGVSRVATATLLPTRVLGAAVAAAAAAGVRAAPESVRSAPDAGVRPVPDVAASGAAIMP